MIGDGNEFKLKIKILEKVQQTNTLFLNFRFFTDRDLYMITSTKKQKGTLIILLLLTGLAIILNCFGFLQGQDWGDDFAGYIIQAKTIISGDYTLLQQQQEINNFILNYPWGFPLILAPMIHLFETNYFLLKLYIYSFFLISLVVIYLIFKKDSFSALLVVFLCASNTYFSDFKNNINSDFPHLLFSLISIFLIHRIFILNKQLFTPYGDALLIGFVVFISYIIRTQSFIFLAVLPVAQLYKMKKSFRKAELFIYFVPYAVIGCFYMGMQMLIPVKAVSYRDGLVDYDILQTFATNFFYYINIWQELFNRTLILKELSGVMAGICIFLCFLGMLSTRREHFIFSFYFICGLLLVLFLPFYQGLRYLMPFVPFFIYFTLIGLNYVFINLTEVLRKRIALSFALVIGLLNLSTLNTMRASSRNVQEGPYTASSTEVFDYISKNCNPDAIISYWKPRALLLYTGRNSFMATDLDLCKTKKADFYLFYRKAYADQLSMDTIIKYKSVFTQTFSNKDFTLFRINRDSLSFHFMRDSILSYSEKMDLVYASPKKTIVMDNQTVLPIWSADKIHIKPVRLTKGCYTIEFVLKGTSALGEDPLVEIECSNVFKKTLSCSTGLKAEHLSFCLKADGIMDLELRLLNDYSDANQDRNAFLQHIVLTKKDSL